MDLAKIQNRSTLYLISFRKLLLDSIGSFLTSSWKQKEKEGVVPVDETTLDDVLRIQAEGLKNQSSGEIRKYSKKFRNTFYVIKDMDKVVGYCVYYIKPALSFRGLKKKAVIYSIAVDREFRGKGFGKKLLKETIEEMKLNGISSIFLYVNTGNLPAIKLYEKTGFHITKEVRNICGKEEQCYRMELKLA